MKPFRDTRRQAVDITGESLVHISFLCPDKRLPLVISPGEVAVELSEWAEANVAFLDTKLLEHGAVLLRGFPVFSVPCFEKTALALCPTLFGEYGDLPREPVGVKVYGSTPYPADESILFHNEGSHLPVWPRKQLFCCLEVPEQGGETPLLDCREVYRQLDSDLLQRFGEKGLEYLRHFSKGLDISWQRFFRSEDKRSVEDTCRREGMSCSWTADGGLGVRRRARAILKHPRTGDMVFFNQVQLHHPYCLNPTVRASLRAVVKEEDLPRNVFFGDGTPIADAVMRRIGEIYDGLAVSFAWQKGDLLMLDNMLVAHGRYPYRGSRRIVVAMGEMVDEKHLEAI
jgi:hypothetical protein